MLPLDWEYGGGGSFLTLLLDILLVFPVKLYLSSESDDEITITLVADKE